MTKEASMRNDLFQPVRLGAYQLANRIVMAPLTRSRAGTDGAASSIMAEYYGQRATAGLIIAEATNISPQARGYAFTPGLYTAAQVEAWRLVTEAVHAKAGRIFVQLWHVGRVSHPSLQPDGALPVAPSAIRPDATSYSGTGCEPCVTPRALETNEIPAIVDQYCSAARNALAAGFGGVEIHAANGYLIEQFLRDSTNKRGDSYGGSRDKRARFLLGVTVGGCRGLRRRACGHPPVTVELGQRQRARQRSGGDLLVYR
jgi:N-ethylmaleimide reductase